MSRQIDSPYTVGEKPELEDLIEEAIRVCKLDTYTALPAKVVTFSPGPPVPTATVQVDIARAVLGPTGTSVVEQAIPPIANVPVEYFRGGGFRMSAYLLPGNQGCLWVSDRAIDRWRDQGGPFDPQIGRLHSLRDCFFRPGIHSKTNPAASAVPTGGFIIEKEDGTASIQILATGEIKLSSATAVSMLTGSDIGSFLLALYTGLSSWVVAPLDGGGALKTALTASGFFAKTPPGP